HDHVGQVTDAVRAFAEVAPVVVDEQVRQPGRGDVPEGAGDVGGHGDLRGDPLALEQVVAVDEAGAHLAERFEVRAVPAFGAGPVVVAHEADGVREGGLQEEGGGGVEGADHGGGALVDPQVDVCGGPDDRRVGGQLGVGLVNGGDEARVGGAGVAERFGEFGDGARAAPGWHYDQQVSTHLLSSVFDHGLRRARMP